eukprot:TRINITY_DN28447_c0_g1_i1.p1 TRINITY_DN28447_c0_g1~~TRINITY_DN28447_c0_g1_i1.p1  ORF type:complete len:324 (+),score=86.06 TRINITY_DN28447_c0_g1_i1:80-973(+)
MQTPPLPRPAGPPQGQSLVRPPPGWQQQQQQRQHPQTPAFAVYIWEGARREKDRGGRSVLRTGQLPADPAAAAAARSRFAVQWTDQEVNQPQTPPEPHCVRPPPAAAPAVPQGAVEVCVRRTGVEPLGCRLEQMVLVGVADINPGVSMRLLQFVGRRLTHINGSAVNSLPEVSAAAATPGPLRLRFAAVDASESGEVDLAKLVSEPMGTSWGAALRLQAVVPGSAAERCGLRRYLGHTLTHINDVPMSTADDVLRLRVVPNPDGSMRLRMRFDRGRPPQPAAHQGAAVLSGHDDVIR